MKDYRPPSITSAPASTDQDRHRRMVNYGTAMSIRAVCILAVFALPGWWRIIPAFAAVLLPYVAVIGANMPRPTTRTSTPHDPRDLASGRKIDD